MDCTIFISKDIMVFGLLIIYVIHGKYKVEVVVGKVVILEHIHVVDIRIMVGMKILIVLKKVFGEEDIDYARSRSLAERGGACVGQAQPVMCDVVGRYN